MTNYSENYTVRHRKIVVCRRRLNVKKGHYAPHICGSVAAGVIVSMRMKLFGTFVSENILYICAPFQCHPNKGLYKVLGWLIRKVPETHT